MTHIHVVGLSTGFEHNGFCIWNNLCWVKWIMCAMRSGWMVRLPLEFIRQLEYFSVALSI